MLTPEKFWKRRKRTKPRGRSISNSENDMLLFLWKWKLSPPGVLKEAFFKKDSARSFNKRLKKLETNAVIENIADWGAGFSYWQLTDWGMHIIKNSLNVKDFGYHTGSAAHDKMVLKVVYGSWLFEKENRPGIFSEQDLTRLDVDWPDTFPKFYNRMPDGLWVWGKRNVVIEVESTERSVERYKDVFSAYRYNNSIHQVLWVYKNPQFLEQCKSAIEKLHLENVYGHLFVSFEEFNKNFLNSRVTRLDLSELGLLKNLLQGKEGVDPSESQGNIGMKIKMDEIFSRQKYLKIQKAYPEKEIAENSVNIPPIG